MDYETLSHKLTNFFQNVGFHLVDPEHAKDLDWRFLGKFILACAAFAPVADLPLSPNTYLALTGLEIALIVALVVAVAATATMAIMAPKPDIEDVEPSGLGDYNFPTNLESRYIPVVWGSTRIDGPNVIWYGDFSAYPLTTGGSVIGHSYSLGVDQALCWGPVDEITQIQVDDEFILKPGQTASLANGAIAPVTGYSRPTSGERTFSFNDGSFFGGRKKGGRLIGDLSFYYGTDDQTPSGYIKSVEAANTYELSAGPPAVTTSKDNLVPAYPGLCHMVWEGGEISERAVLPQFKVTLHRYPTSLSASFSKVRQNTADGTADANPIHVLYEILTDTNWGLSIDPSLINKDSFLSAAEECHEEGNGFSFTIQSPKQAKGVIDKINDQVNGILFQDENGLFKYTLNRKAYREWDNAILDYDGAEVGDLTSVAEINGTLLAGLTYDYRMINTGELGSSSSVGDKFKLVGASGASGWVEVMSKDGSVLEFNKAPFEAGTALNAQLGNYQGWQRRDASSIVPTVDKSSIIKVKTADRQGWNETFNTVQVKYLDRNSEYKETYANAVDSGNMAVQNGRKTIKTYDMQGIRHPETAAIVAQRKLRSLAYPLTSVNVEVSREHSNLRPGDIVEVNHPDFGLTDFYLRVLEVGLPKDSSGNVMLRGMRDVFDEPTSPVQVGGSSTLTEEVAIQAVPATSIEVTGLPQFYHEKFGLAGSAYHSWHIVGAPNSTSTNAQAFQLNAGVYEEKSDQATLPPTGKVVGHVSDIWQDRTVATRYIRESRSTDYTNPGPYGRSMGPHTSPMFHDTNIGDAMVLGKSTNAMRLPTPTGSIGRKLGDIIVKDLTTSRDNLLATFTDEQIQTHGFGLALVRPAWANGDSRFDEIIAYKQATKETIYYGVDRRVTYSGIGWRRTETVIDTEVIDTVEPNHEVRESHTILLLTEVYRGLLDTGIQVLNTDSEILFISAGDIMYDTVGQTGTVTNQTYRHQTVSVGSAIDLATQATDKTGTAAEIKRRDRPAPPVQLDMDSEGADNFWGRNRYDDGRFEQFYIREGDTSPTFQLNWKHQNFQAGTNKVDFYSENDSTIANESVRLTFNLIDDDRTGTSTPTSDQREQHARARFKEGWMPTNPAVSHGVEGAADLGFSATVVSDQTANGTTGVSVNVQTLLAGAGATLTAGQTYFVEVWVQSLDNSVTPAVASRGAQRTLWKFVAA